MKSIAVLMSTYNGERFLKEQIDSILLQQTECELCLLVRDDGSTDGTLEILSKYEEEGSLRFVAGDNVGAALGFMTLLKENNGYDYYAFADQDDIWNADKLQNGIDAIGSIQGPAMYCTNCELVDSHMNKIGRNTHRCNPSYTLESILCLASCAQGCTSILNKELAQIIQENDLPDVFIMHDSLITCLCALVGGTIIYDNKPSMRYRMHDNNVFGMVSAKQSYRKVIQGRIKEIIQKKRISMYDQAESILNTYMAYIPINNRKTCGVVIDAKDSIIARLKLVFCRKLKHDTLNKTITKKLEILLGND